jgi:hypothetical protein
MSDFSKQALSLADRIKPLLAGIHPSIQGAALAELTATWLQCHFILGDQTETQELRIKLLDEQIKCIRALLEVHGSAAK